MSRFQNSAIESLQASSISLKRIFIIFLKRAEKLVKNIGLNLSRGVFRSRKNSTKAINTMRGPEPSTPTMNRSHFLEKARKGK